MSKPFTGLKMSIRKSLQQAKPIKTLGDEIYGEPLRYAVPAKILKILQAEYNINFVEPEAEQLEIL